MGGIDLSVESGQFFGLLGPNGAGKSTTIGMLTTLILPTGGRAWVSGLDVVADPVGVKRRIGVVTQNNTLVLRPEPARSRTARRAAARGVRTVRPA